MAEKEVRELVKWWGTKVAGELTWCITDLPSKPRGDVGVCVTTAV